MIPIIDHSGSVEGLRSAVEQVLSHDNIQGLLILAASDNGFTPELIDPLLKDISVPLFGGVFPAIIAKGVKLEKGTLVIGCERKIDVQLINDLSNPESDFDEVIDTLIPDVGNAKTMFVFVDGCSERVVDLTESLFNIFGLELNYIGGGAGSINSVKLNFQHSYCLITNQGMQKDSAILALTDIESGIGVRHGWDITVSGAHKVTEVDGNVIKTLDWQPAFEVYKAIVDKHSGQEITEDNFFTISKSYPFGIMKLESEKVIRDPFGVTEENGLIFNAGIPQESFVDILTGNRELLIKAAETAYQDSIASHCGNGQKCALFVDCISRVLFLEDQFDRELAAIGSEDVEVFGVLSIGEIANSGKDYLEMYNKTCVVGVLGD